MPADDLNLPASHGVHNPLMARCWPAGQSNHVSPLSPAALPLCPLRTCIFGQDTCVIHVCACVGVYYMYVYACACVRARACMHACSGQCRSITISLSLSLILSLSLSLSLSVCPSLSLSLCSLWADGEAGRTHTHTHAHTHTHKHTYTYTRARLPRLLGTRFGAQTRQTGLPRRMPCFQGGVEFGIRHQGANKPTDNNHR